MSYTNYINSISSDSQCGFDYELIKNVEKYNIDFQAYYNTIQQFIADPNFKRTQKIFPIMFTVLDDGKFDRLDLDIDYILKWVNYWFSGTKIQFAPVEKNPIGYTLETPGLTILAANDKGINNQIYQNAFTRIAPYKDAENLIPIYGIDYDVVREKTNIYKNCLNIVLVNKTSSGGSDIFMSAVHPYVADYSELFLHTGIVDLYAIGKMYDSNNPAVFNPSGSSDYTHSNFGYKYSGDSPAMGNNSLNHWKDRDKGNAVRARSIVHTLGHMLGLMHPRTSYKGSAVDFSLCSDLLPTIFESAFVEGVTYDDPFSDTESGNLSGVQMHSGNMNYTDCNGDSIVKSCNSHMHNNTTFPGWTNPREAIPEYQYDFHFTSQQIDWMHANCEYRILRDGQFEFGVLGNILLNLDESFLSNSINTTFKCANPAQTTPSKAIKANQESVLRLEDKRNLFNSSEHLINNVLKSII